MSKDEILLVYDIRTRHGAYAPPELTENIAKKWMLGEGIRIDLLACQDQLYEVTSSLGTKIGHIHVDDIRMHMPQVLEEIIDKTKEGAELQ